MTEILADILHGADSWNWEVFLRLLAASAFGALIGAERQHRGRSAGLRTHLLVCLGAAVAMVVSLHFADVFGGDSPQTRSLRIDPARVAYGVMGGVGFLGAGAILRYGIGIRGLTTAASLWCTAAVGLASGFGMYVVAAYTTAIVIVALLFLSRLDQFIPARHPRTIVVTLPAGGEDPVARLAALFRKQGARIANVDYEFNRKADRQTLTFHVSLPAGRRDKRGFDVASILADAPEIENLTVR